MLILDEPANGLDPEGIRWLRGFLRHLSADQGKTILVSSHLLQEVEQTVDDVVIIANGVLVKQGTMAELGGGGGALVRTSDPERLALALRERGLARHAAPTARSWPRPTTCAWSARSPTRPGCPSGSSATGPPTWRQLFFDLTSGGNRNLGDAAGPDRGRRRLMRAAVRSELLKFFTTRVWWGMAIALFVAGAAFALLFGILFTSETLAEQAGGPGGLPTGDDLQVANSVYTAGLTVGYLLMLCIGVLQIGTEYRHKTLSATFLA